MQAARRYNSAMSQDTPDDAAPQPHEARSAADAPSDYEQSRRNANRAQWALNFLVTLSAIAGAAFFFYVLYTIRPWSSTTTEPVNVQTSSAAATWQIVTGGEEAGLWATLRDIDEAPEYRKALSDTWRRDLGIAADGMMYRLEITNRGNTRDLELRSCSLRTVEGASFEVQWLDTLAQPGNATALGRMRLKQSESRFTLEKGESRQLSVFVPATDRGVPPAADGIVSGSLRLGDGTALTLMPEKVKAQAK